MCYLKCLSHDPVANLREKLRRVRAVLDPVLDPVLHLGLLPPEMDIAYVVNIKEPWLTLKNEGLKMGVI